MNLVIAICFMIQIANALIADKRQNLGHSTKLNVYIHVFSGLILIILLPFSIYYLVAILLDCLLAISLILIVLTAR